MSFSISLRNLPNISKHYVNYSNISFLTCFPIFNLIFKTPNNISQEMKWHFINILKVSFTRGIPKETNYQTNHQTRLATKENLIFELKFNIGAERPLLGDTEI